RRLASIGQPHNVCDIRIVDEAEVDCPVGTPGEILVRSPLVMSYYWNKSAATIATMRDGWVRTGDMAFADSDNFLYLVDRKTDMIISGGENIYSQEVEQALMLHAAVADCAVIGVADERWGEAVMAVLVLAGGASANETELLAHCATQIAKYKCPKKFTFVAELPRLPSGKVNKVVLRQQYAAA
ncbi:MAG: AMP-binding protein, partial [Desulfobacterales bacterium]|nr:AMP-binding protein [Desulfobacterales bacterium]